MIEVRRKEGESGESLLRRFSRRVQHSGLLLRAKRRRFYQSKKNKRAVREDALRRKDIREKRDYLRRIGQLEEYDRKYGPRRRRSG